MYKDMMKSCASVKKESGDLQRLHGKNHSVKQLESQHGCRCSRMFDKQSRQI